MKFILQKTFDDGLDEWKITTFKNFRDTLQDWQKVEKELQQRASIPKDLVSTSLFHPETGKLLKQYNFFKGKLLK